MNKTTAMWAAGLLALPFIIYGSFWLAKHGSYWLFYEQLVRETITEMIKPEYLK